MSGETILTHDQAGSFAITNWSWSTNDRASSVECEVPSPR